MPGLPPCSRVFAIVLGFVASLPASLAMAQMREPAVSNRNALLSSTREASSQAPCTCRAMGSSFEVGTEVCINSAMFRCEMDQNVTSWRRTQNVCPTS
jgi:hypothetical protein